ncbi:MAG: ATPase, T2SS/T4P/T4SS family [Pseudomonadota bacterium]
MQLKKRLGEMLIEAGLLDGEKLSQALIEARKAKLKLGAYLIRNGIVSEPEIVDVVARQLKVEKYNPQKYPINLDLAKIIPANVAQKWQVAPLEKKGSLLTIAMNDPTDLNALDAIEVLTNAEVEPLICTEQDLNALLGALYGQYSRLGDVLEDMQDLEVDKEDKGEEASAIEDVEVNSLKDMAEEAPVIRLVNSILSQAIKEGASDIHISPEKDHVQVRFRVDGKLHNVPAPPRAMFLPIISRLKILGNMDIATSRVPQDGRFTIHMGAKEINVRASCLPTIYGENAVLRLLNVSSGIYSLDKLGMANQDIAKLEPMIYKPYGLILSTGPTGSGKSTTLYSILAKINEPDINIITLEDPVEYRVEGIRQVQLNRKAGMTFAGGLRSILRQDPDVIMVGEIRDAETAAIAVQAGLTGHRVLSTVHTNDAAGAITRLGDMGIEAFLVSSVMLVSIAQRLVRRICPNCMERYEPPKASLDYFGISRDEGTTFMRGRGCYSCMNTGYKGRVGLYEVLVVDGLVQDMILQRKTTREITQALRETGALRGLRDDAAEKIRRGVTTPEEAASAVMG